ncbi:MAG: helicase-related protein, partial [Halolamina sp.]
ALVFVDYLDQGEAIADELGAAFVSGETPHYRREKLFESFRTGEREALIVSRVGDEGIDLPNAQLAVVASGLGGSRRQGAQRAGRTMRPVGRAEVVVLATHGTREEEFARKQMRHLAEKGVRVHETVVGDGEETSGEDEASENEAEASGNDEEAGSDEEGATGDDTTAE